MSGRPPRALPLPEGFRWFGPGDPVPLSHIRQAGAREIFSSLHQIPYGEVWPRGDIRIRRETIESVGLRWSVVESVPIHEDIKTGRGDVAIRLSNYAETLRNLAAEGIYTVVYNFMPVLDWVRTETDHILSDGSRTMEFNPVHFAAFDIHALQRPGAESEHDPDNRDRAAIWWATLSESQRDAFITGIIDVFPGVKWGLTLEDIRTLLARYDEIDASILRKNLARFLEAVVPTAEEVGVRLAIHPDDPPFPVLGLPRIVSTVDDLAAIRGMAESPANGFCFCTGSLSARPDNDVLGMLEAFLPHVHAVHLRNTRLLSDGSFQESGHLEGSVNMPPVLAVLLQEQQRRLEAGYERWGIPFRPDHGLTMLDDIAKPPGITPGYSAIGRLKGLAELRGLMAGIQYSICQKDT